MTHPRLKHYPLHADYVALANAFRPFVMFTHEPHYRSKSVNTDKFGLREHYDAAGQFVDLEHAAKQYESCNLLVGGSTAFGVDASSDRHTAAAYLNQPGVPCLNLGIRGAICHQTLQSVLLLRRYLPRIENVVILSGVNLASMASLEDTMFYPEFGGIFSEPWHYDAFCDQYKRFGFSHRQTTRRSALGVVDRWFQGSKWGQIVMRWLARREPVQAPPELRPSIPFDDKLALLEAQSASDLDVWSALQSAWNLRVHYVMQPTAHWTNKPLAPIEKRCIEADLRAIPSIGTYAKRTFYEPYRDRLARQCADRGIAFYDANAWFDSLAGANDELFTDVCHLTDRGYQLLGELIREQVQWKVTKHDCSLRKAA